MSEGGSAETPRPSVAALIERLAPVAPVERHAAYLAVAAAREGDGGVAPPCFEGHVYATTRTRAAVDRRGGARPWRPSPPAAQTPSSCGHRGATPTEASSAITPYATLTARTIAVRQTFSHSPQGSMTACV